MSNVATDHLAPMLVALKTQSAHMCTTVFYHLINYNMLIIMIIINKSKFGTSLLIMMTLIFSMGTCL